jgi:murein DD-endopeptidase / murein LD-carboxypeptidase
MIHHLKLLTLIIAVCLFNAHCTSRIQNHSPAYNPRGIEQEIRDTNHIDRYSRIERQSKKKLVDFKNNQDNRGYDSSFIPGDRIIETAMEYLNVPHCMGGTTARCLDCSGLVMIVFRDFGIDLPHNAQEQSKYGTIVKDKKDLVKGDLVFFRDSYKTTRFITHSGIYAGDNEFIHTSSGKGVTITSLDDSWWKGKYVFGTRVLK